jgi:hypothetical protein
VTLAAGPKPIAILDANPLKGLPALRRPHLSWPFPEPGNLNGKGPRGGYLSNSSTAFLDGFLHDFVRVTGSCPLGLSHTTQLEVATCAALCHINAAEPSKCIAVNYSPWYAKFPGSDPTVTGATEDAEMAYYTGLLGSVSAWLATAEHGSAVGIGAFLLDQEKFSASPDTPAGTVKALTRKCDLIYNASMDRFPRARVEWYNRGGVSWSPTYGWIGPAGGVVAADIDKQWSHFTMDELGSSVSVSIYNIRELWLMREVYRRTAAYAQQRNASGGALAESVAGGVTPWIALGTGDHLLPTHNCSTSETRYNEPCGKFDFAIPYDPVNSWQLGTELNNMSQYSNTEHPEFPPSRAFAPWDAAQVVCMYPSILDPRASPTAGGGTSMVDHFVAYVRGAGMLEGVRTPIKVDDTTASTVARRAPPCQDAADCAYAGVCSGGTCRCRHPWKGPRCSELDLKPMDPTGGLHLAHNWTWGGSVIQSRDGRYHMFVMHLVEHCGIQCYQTNGEVLHATAATPTGPFSVQGVAIAPRPGEWDADTISEPAVYKAPDGTYLLFHMG